MDKFIEITHEAYYRELGDSFGDTIPSIFTDEPQFCHKSTLGFAEEKKKVVLPYTDDFNETYKALTVPISLIPSRNVSGSFPTAGYLQTAITIMTISVSASPTPLPTTSAAGAMSTESPLPVI